MGQSLQASIHDKRVEMNNYGGGGYPQQPSGQQEQIRQWFQAVDADRSGQISATELQRALVNGNMSKFSEETCRMLISMFDNNHSGTIDVDEFISLFNFIEQWRRMFQGFDRDGSGSIDESEFGQALRQLGYNFSPTFVQNILIKYDARCRKLNLDNFIMVLTQLRRLTESFKRRDMERRGQAFLNYEDFLGLSMGCHQKLEFFF